MIKINKWTKNLYYPFVPFNEKIPSTFIGYGIRNAPPVSIVIHTTNGNKGSTLESEADFLTHSRNVGAHFLVGKDGKVIQLLDPLIYYAWHAGVVYEPQYNNFHSIGIENHHAIGDVWTKAQVDALSALISELMHQFSIPYTSIETHRKIAKPGGRKTDPNDWSDASFYTWRKSLYINPAPVSEYSVNFNRSYVRNGPAFTYDVPIELDKGVILIGGDIKTDENNTYRNGTNQWLHIKEIINGKYAGIKTPGFIHMSLVSKK